MRLLLDQNLSHRLVPTLQDVFPDSIHVRDVGLASADDISVWVYARANGFVIASKDSDFRQLSFVYGAPSKVIWIRCGNCQASEVEALLRQRHEDVLTFNEDQQSSFLVLD